MLQRRRQVTPSAAEAEAARWSQGGFDAGLEGGARRQMPVWSLHELVFSGLVSSIPFPGRLLTFCPESWKNWSDTEREEFRRRFDESARAVRDALRSSGVWKHATADEQRFFETQLTERTLAAGHRPARWSVAGRARGRSPGRRSFRPTTVSRIRESRSSCRRPGTGSRYVQPQRSSAPARSRRPGTGAAARGS